VLDSVSLVGEATIPVSNIVLGATLGTISLKVWPKFIDLLKITSIKFIELGTLQIP
jgi:predicted permease